MTVEEIIYNQAIADGMPDNFARLMVAWAASETAYNGLPFNSNVFHHCNNCYGYKWVGQSTADGSCLLSPEGDYYAYYHSIAQSVHEISLWVKRRQSEGLFPADLRTITTPYQLAYLLKVCGYYGDTLEHYSSNLQTWWTELSNMPLTSKTTGVFLLLLLGGGLAYHFRRQLFNSKREIIFV